MPEVTTRPLGAPCWIDLMTSDIPGAKRFYGELFGWEYVDGGPEYGGYLTITSRGLDVGGMMAQEEGSEIPDSWSVYLSVTDTSAIASRVEGQGGAVVVEPMEVPEMGTMVFYMDAVGAGVGSWQPGTYLGYAVADEPGAPGWHELVTRDYAKAVDFYTAAFGWQTRDMPEAGWRYTCLVDGGEQYAGIMDGSEVLPEGVPSYWRTYFGVTDTDAAVAKATELGGTVLEPPVDSPYGRMALLADPTGAVFMIYAAGGAAEA